MRQAPVISLQATLTGLASFILIGAAQALYGPSLTGFTAAFQLRSGSAGLIVSVHSAGALLGVLSAIPLARHPLARWRVAVSLCLLSLGALLVGVAYSWPTTLAGAFIIGLAYGALTIGINSLFAVAYGDRSPAMVNLLNAIFGIGAILSPLLILLFPERPQFAFVTLSAISTCLIPFGFTMDDRLEAKAPAPASQSKHLFIIFVIFLALGVGVEASSIGFAATYLVFTGLSPSAAAAVISLFFVAFTLARLLAVPLSLKLTPVQLVMGSLCLTALLLLLSMRAALAPVTIALLGASLALFFPNSFTWLSQELGTSGSSVVIIAGALVGSTLVSSLIAAVTTSFGEGYILGALLILTVCTGLVATTLLVQLRRSKH